jgi:uncharacterized protein
MTEALPIYKNQDFYVPSFEVKVGNRPVDREVIHDITQVSYRDSLEEVDSFEITISNWDGGTRTFKYSDSDIFNPGQTVELRMGYLGREPLRLVLTGEITSLRPSFPAGGQPNLSVSGLNLIHRLRKKQESHAYRNKTDNEIAKEVAARLGIKIETKEPAQGTQERYKYILQDNQYDILFLTERATRIGYDLFVVEGNDDGQSILYFGPSDKVKRVTYELKYGLSLIEFQPSLDTANQVDQVTVQGWDAVKKQPIRATATRADLSTKGLGDRRDQANIARAFKDREEVISDKPVQSAQEARTLAKETLERTAKNMVTASGSVVGLPDLRAGSVLFITGVGARFSGRYFVHKTTHTIGDGGYTTQFECRLEELEEDADARRR